MMHKDSKEISTTPEVVELGMQQTDLPPEKAGTQFDQRDMNRVGKKQELRVRSSPFPPTPRAGR